jgi:hypothetical protein
MGDGEETMTRTQLVALERVLREVRLAIEIDQNKSAGNYDDRASATRGDFERWESLLNSIHEEAK